MGLRQDASMSGREGPLYLQLAHELQRRIVDGAFVPDAMLPSEAELASTYGMSRVTIRRALGCLQDRGLIYRRRGRGTFVNPPHVRQQLSHEAQTIIEALHQEGIEPEVKVLGLEHLKLPPPISEILGTADRETVVLRRLYSYDGAPIALVTLYLPLPMSGVAYILAQPENSHETTYSIFEQQMGLTIKEAKHIVKTIQLQKSQANDLGMNPGDLCLEMERITYSSQGGVLELISYIYPPGRMQFEISLPRHNVRTVINRVYPVEPPDRHKHL